ncbi:MAG: class I SAM-dependent methyltransferase [Planctomycetota bacterium]
MIASGTGSMRTDWNLRAQDNYQLAIANVHQEEDFLRSGQADAEVLLNYLGPEPVASWKVMDYGCGVGRLLRPLARSFADLHGVDISDEMVRIGRTQLADLPNVRLHVLDGDRLPFPDRSFDLVYSMHVFQHMPKEAFRALVPEIARILRPGGTFLFHLTYPYTLRRQFQAWLGVDRSRTDTYRRRFYSLGRIRRLLGASGFQLLRWDRPERKFAWYLARTAGPVVDRT